MKEFDVSFDQTSIFGPSVRHGGGEKSLNIYLPCDHGRAAAFDNGSPEPVQAPMAGVVPNFGQRFYRRLGKPALDLVFILLTLPLTLPIILLCALALWFEGGNPFYRQARLGKDGRVFHILKLRTMVHDAEARLVEYLRDNPERAEEWHRTQKLRDDPRVTRLGAVLRSSSLDELPQLWNVFRGEMSLVGPRPMLPEQLPLYGDPEAYFAVRPGITGLWQVSSRSDNKFSERCRQDSDYYANLSLGGDLRLMMRTVGVVMRHSGC